MNKLRPIRLIVIVAILALVGSAPPVPTGSAPGGTVRGTDGVAAGGPSHVGGLELAAAGGQSKRPKPKPTPTPSPTPAPTPNPTVSASPTPSPTPAASPSPSPTPTPTPTASGTLPPLGACPIFPSTNVWNEPVNALPVASNSPTMINAIGSTAGLHPDFSAAGAYGIPFNVVGSATPRSTVSFLYADESDNVGYPIPANPLVEGGSDRHILMVDTSACRLYELYDAVLSGSAWTAGSGATWDLRSNALRPDGWTSADAAGLPIFPGLVRYDEVASGVIRHAIRFTAPKTCAGHVYPARHDAGSGSCSTYPPMGLRLRLKASVDISGYGSQARVVLQALRTYGMILADNGSPFYITGAPDSRWNDDVLHTLGQLHGSDFEVVDTAGFVNG